MKSFEIQAPRRIQEPDKTKIFLAGSIEMETAEKWHQRVIDAFPVDMVFYNPRRDDWDSSWEQDLNSPKFYEQVNWEMDKLEEADYIFFYFDPNTKSPISLLELGMMSAYFYKIVVYCPSGFWRKGNVDILCARKNICCFSNFETAIICLKNKIRNA